MLPSFLNVRQILPVSEHDLKIRFKIGKDGKTPVLEHAMPDGDERIRRIAPNRDIRHADAHASRVASTSQGGSPKPIDQTIMKRS